MGNGLKVEEESKEASPAAASVSQPYPPLTPPSLRAGDGDALRMSPEDDETDPDPDD